MIRGTRRPGGAGRTRGGSGGGVGDSVGPGDGTLAGCLNTIFWLIIIVAVCAVLALLL